jgi:hypothetical protein
VALVWIRSAASYDELDEMLAKITRDRRAAYFTASKRAADIKKTLSIGVHGLKMMHTWSNER